ncbi:peptidase, S9A/B/C family, catalytic domain protein [Gamsiella multidivaricata]|uniref:peptidase, S9A/B/C family, catalytic domain protein n=1 Tax=Gamsiella multidivaricata TaxID=101098 RepID=UPI0022202D5C|nr:peptidase, S9A/B/C family, catalytic domain protein [Gamsiella multidivaricata]KAI7816327.1 peptidase, S9A/B/C family, catalytic domain protein [Gamsiella multidivaricata]
MLTLARPSAASLSPNGRLAVFSASRYAVDTNKSIRNLHLVDLADNNTLSDLTPQVPDTNHDNAVWLDDNSLAFLAKGQLHVKAVGSDSEPYILTHFPVDITNVKFNRAANLIAFSAAVYTDGTLEGAREKDEYIKVHKKDTALAFDTLMVRHWDEFIQEKKNNIFVVKIKRSGDKFVVDGHAINLLLNTGLESPTIPFGDQGDYDISPNGQEIVFVSKINTPDNAWQTTTHIYTVPVTGGVVPKNINPESVGAASHPVFSSTGRSIAYLQMLKPQYEADRNRIVVHFNGQSRIVAKDWNRSPSSILFDSKDENIFVTAEDQGHVKVFKINLQTESIEPIVNEHSQSGLSLIDDNTLLYSTASLTSPSDLFTVDIKTKDIQRRTNVHAKTLANVYLATPEDVWFKGDQGRDIHGFLLKPIGFDPSKKYPLAFIVHGGPQSAFNDNWSTRWNPNIFASAGFVVVFLNPTGSTGYGQELTDAINNNWGGSPYIDLMKGLDYVLEHHAYIDQARVAALGASYGGYMMNWINGHTDRFNCLVNHDGIFDTKNGFYATEELYFPEHEYGGVPWDPKAKDNYERWNPANFVQNWKTPTLVIHSDKDYRLPVTEGLSTFTVLQRKGIPSRFVYFPDENHWVLKAANSLRWHAEVINWIQKWTAEPKRNVNGMEETFVYETSQVRIN